MKKKWFHPKKFKGISFQAFNRVSGKDRDFILVPFKNSKVDKVLSFESWKAAKQAGWKNS